MQHISQSSPESGRVKVVESFKGVPSPLESGLGFQVKGLGQFQGVPSPLESGLGVDVKVLVLLLLRYYSRA